MDLPKKHGRGGQSALRFARLREEKRHNYVRKVAELSVTQFITNDKVNVAGIVLAGSADFKVNLVCTRRSAQILNGYQNDLNASDMFDNRLSTKVIKVVDVSYGGEVSALVESSTLVQSVALGTLSIRLHTYSSARNR